MLETDAPSTAVISAHAISENAARMREVCGTEVMAVVKADGFGLGAERVARAALAGGAGELGVATCEEAIGLRECGIEEPILAWLLHERAPLARAVEHGIRLSLTSPAQVEQVAGIAAERGLTAEIELELETGMNRSGCERAQWAVLFAAAHRAERAGRLRVVGVWTHLAGTSAAEYTPALALLDAGLALARGAGLRPRSHAAASVPAVTDPRTRRDVVRLGASLFGIEPRRAQPVGLRPVLRWESTVAQIREARAGELVGYGRDPIPEPTRLGLVPIGYADGLPRRGSPGLEVSVGGRRVPLLGAVSMDQSVIDLGPHDVVVGDTVTLIGEPSRGEPGLSEWADALGTIPQEILTGLGPRVARREEAAA